MLQLIGPNTEPIAGYRLIEPLGKGGFGEVWKCEAPGGLFKAIKFVAGSDLGMQQDAAGDELRALQRIKALRHPFLLSIERIEIIRGSLVMVTELADKSLQDVLTERRRAGLPGIPRPELLRYLREAADVLDLLNLQHDLQHLDIKPGNLFLVSNHVKLGDFGLVHSLAEIKGQKTAKMSIGAITPRYAAPELFRGGISTSCDQYSLAIVFQELLTGTVPFAGKNARQLAMQHTGETPDLKALSPADRDVVARALAKDAEDRFPNCTAFVQALEAVGGSNHGTAAPGAGTSQVPLAADTRTDMSGAATTHLRPTDGKFLPDYKFVRQLGRTPTSEAWEAVTPDRSRKLVKFLFSVTGHDKRREQEAIARLGALKHKGIPAVEALPGGPGCLIVVTDLIETTLRDRFQEARTKGAKGLPRRQLLDWLSTAAETLDELAKRYQLQHLALNPRNLLLADGKLVIGEYGLQALLRGTGPSSDASGQGRYSAPELVAGNVSPHCDQYSLAVIYQEMLTGSHPLRAGRNRPADVAALPEAERTVIERVLNTDPKQRFNSCADFIDALEAAVPKKRGSSHGVPLEQTPSTSQQQVYPGCTNQVLARLLAQAAESMPPPEPPAWLTEPEGGIVLEGRFHASLPPQGAEAKFEGFRREWSAHLTHTGENTLTYHLGIQRRFWQRWFGKAPGLIVEIRWTRALPPLTPFPQTIVRVRAKEAGRPGESLLREIGPVLLDAIRTQLQGGSERRRDERLVWGQPVMASFILPNGERSEMVEGQGKDISLHGMAVYLPHVLAGSRLELTVQIAGEARPVSLEGNFVRVQRCGDGWFEAGLAFD